MLNGVLLDKICATAATDDVNRKKTKSGCESGAHAAGIEKLRSTPQIAGEM